jgi:flagellar biosynthesis/type III secretory pathway protein FliH
MKTPIRSMALMAMSIMLLLAGVACDDSQSPVMPPPLTPAQVCALIQGCTTTATGYQFSDGDGGIVSCSNGVCVDNNPNFSPNYNNGYAAGQTDGYATGYNNGVPVGENAGYNQGYADGQNSPSNTSYQQGYNQGLPQGQNAGYNAGYSEGNGDAATDAYNAGYNQAYDSAYNSQYNSSYNSEYNSSYGSAYNSAYNGSYNSGYNSGYDNGYSDGYYDGSYGYSVGGVTKDVDLQRAKIQEQKLADQAEALANQFQMSVESATQLTQLSQKVKKMAMTGHMTVKDREAITKSALAVAGITVDEVNEAFAHAMAGDKSATDDLLDKAASNLGMNSSADLRDKLLPSFGVNF